MISRGLSVAAPLRIGAMYVLVLLLAWTTISASERSKFEVYIEKQIAADRIVVPHLKRSESRMQTFCPTAASLLAKKVFFDYGALYVAHDADLPPRCVFEDARQVSEFQARLKIVAVTFGNSSVELQETAMRALLDARNDAADAGIRLTPLDGSIAGRRSYDDTVRLWMSRFDRALAYWNRRGSISDTEVSATRSAPYAAQAERVIAWESNGIWFGTSLRSSIFSSVAPPGTSQHLSLMALDVVEYENRDLVSILNKHGWYQTIVGDSPHFTYLGATAEELPKRGLKFVYSGSIGYWVPDESPAPR